MPMKLLTCLCPGSSSHPALWRTEIPCLFSDEGIPIQASKDAGLLPLPKVSAFSR